MKSDQISQFLQERIDANDFPSAVYLVAEKGEVVFQDALGYAVVEPERIEAKMDTIYDLASLTKPLVTGLLSASWIDQGCWQLESRITGIASASFASANEKLEIRHLLTHTSELPAWYPLYSVFIGSEERHNVILNEILEMTTEGDLDHKVVYSDLNFILLSFCLAASNESPRISTLKSLFDETIAAALRLENTYFNPTKHLQKRIAASEKGNAYEEQICIERAYFSIGAGGEIIRPIPHSAFRDYQIWGEVHDGNAHFMGGVAGHAGLFSTAEEVFKIAQQFLPNYSKLLKPETCELFRTNFTPGMNEHRSFAFQLASTPDSTAGTRMSPESFGHLGFTGTSLWIDPVKERVFVLLTNRTHHHDPPFVNINSVRRRFHDLAIDLLEKNASN